MPNKEQLSPEQVARMKEAVAFMLNISVEQVHGECAGMQAMAEALAPALRERDEARADNAAMLKGAEYAFHMVDYLITEGIVHSPQRDRLKDIAEVLDQTLTHPHPGQALLKELEQYKRAAEDALNVRPELAVFVRHMEKVMQVNDHKGGWQRDTLEAIEGRLCEEWQEYMEAETPEQKRREIIDVANFCMMLWDMNLRANVDARQALNQEGN